MFDPYLLSHTFIEEMRLPQFTSYSYIGLEREKQTDSLAD